MIRIIRNAIALLAMLLPSWAFASNHRPAASSIPWAVQFSFSEFHKFNGTMVVGTACPPPKTIFLMLSAASLS